MSVENIVEIEMPLSFNKITHFNMKVDYTKKLINKLKSRKISLTKREDNSKEHFKNKSKSKSEYGEWRNETGELHRENDLPAIIRSDGTKQWWINGKLHRENDKPAIIRSNGIMEWWFNGRPFRQNKKPIIEYPNDNLLNEILNTVNNSVQKKCK